MGENAKAYQKMWNMPSLLTEHQDNEVGELAVAAGIGQLYWEYSGYCNTAPDSRCRHMPKHQHKCRGDNATAHCQFVPGCNFGACITGYGRKLDLTWIEEAIVAARRLSPSTIVV